MLWWEGDRQESWRKKAVKKTVKKTVKKAAKKK